MLRILWVCLVSTALLAPAAAQDPSGPLRHEVAKAADRATLPLQAVTADAVPCVEGMAGAFACNNVDLLSFLPLASIGDTLLNDIWGWTDPETGHEYALVGRQNGVSFVDVTDPVNPVYVGDLPKTAGTPTTIWRDIKVYEHFALVVADNAGDHGVQIFDLRQLRNVSDPPETFSESARYGGIRSAHNIVVNESAGFAYAVGSSSELCGPGLHMIDVRDPLNPSFAGCFAANGTGRHGTGYTHDAQCVMYEGPDPDYSGREVCMAANETALNIVDVTDKENPFEVARASYPNVQYAHQGWLTEDHRYLLMDDELDEVIGDTAGGAARTRTIVWDVIDLDDPQVDTLYLAQTTSIDHNQYVVDGRAFQANYTSGLRVLDVSNPSELNEIAFFDTYPEGDGIGFDGAWSVYPFFESGNVVVSSINEGLFVLRPTGAASVDVEPSSDVPVTFRLLPAYPNPFNPRTTIALDVDRPQHIRVSVYDVQGREVAELFSGFAAEPGRRAFTLDARGLASGVYVVRADGEAGRRTLTVTLQK